MNAVIPQNNVTKKIQILCHLTGTCQLAVQMAVTYDHVPPDLLLTSDKQDKIPVFNITSRTNFTYLKQLYLINFTHRRINYIHSGFSLRICDC